MTATIPLVARKGRASYLGERSAGTKTRARPRPGCCSRRRRHARRGGALVIGLVLVSHSARLAEGVAELAAQMAGPDLAIAVAGGLDLPGKPLGTDAALVAQAIEHAWSPDGVLVLMDLGSAVLSAELALDLLPDERRDRRAPVRRAPGRGSRGRRRGGGPRRLPRDRRRRGARGTRGKGRPAGRARGRRGRVRRACARRSCARSGRARRGRARRGRARRGCARRGCARRGHARRGRARDPARRRG